MDWEKVWLGLKRFVAFISAKRSVVAGSWSGNAPRCHPCSTFFIRCPCIVFNRWELQAQYRKHAVRTVTIAFSISISDGSAPCRVLILIGIRYEDIYLRYVRAEDDQSKSLADDLARSWCSCNLGCKKLSWMETRYFFSQLYARPALLRGGQLTGGSRALSPCTIFNKHPILGPK